MGQGRKKDQGPFHHHHRRNKSSSVSSTGTVGQQTAKPATAADDLLFSDLGVVAEEQLVWVTWQELSVIFCVGLAILGVVFYGNYAVITSSLSALLMPEQSRTGTTTSSPAAPPTTLAARQTPFIDNNVRATIAEQLKPITSSAVTGIADDFLQLVEETPTTPVECRTEDNGHYNNHNSPQPPDISFDAYTNRRPHLCGSDGTSYGYETYQEFAEIMEEINAYSHERYVEWDSFYERNTGFDGKFQNPHLYYDEEIVVTICPKAVLRRTSSTAPAVYINAENLLIECEDCTLEISSGSHLIFGAYAQAVMIRGIHFKGATETSIRFPYDGAEVFFEDCFFSENGSRGKHIGTVADINSTSSVDFMRCLMLEPDGALKTSSLSIRSKEEDTTSTG